MPVIGPRVKPAGGLAGADPAGPPGGDFGDAVARRGLESPVFEAPSAMVARWWMGFDGLRVSTPETITSGEDDGKLSIVVNLRRGSGLIFKFSGCGGSDAACRPPPSYFSEACWRRGLWPPVAVPMVPFHPRFIGYKGTSGGGSGLRKEIICDGESNFDVLVLLRSASGNSEDEAARFWRLLHVRGTQSAHEESRLEVRMRGTIPSYPCLGFICDFTSLLFPLSNLPAGKQP